MVILILKWKLHMSHEMRKMLKNGLQEVIEDMIPGFYSCLFLVEKVTCSWRAVISLSSVNM